MKLKKRVLFLLTLPVLILLIGGGLLYFFMVHRFKDSLKFIVNKESRGRYVFDAGDAQLSVWDKTIVLKESVLYNQDSVNADVAYRISIHEIYFSLASWKELLFHKKIVADSLSIERPDINIHVHKMTGPKAHPDFHPSDLVTYLEKTLQHFNVHAFTLKEAAFTYEGPTEGIPLHGDHINLALTNFTRVNNEDSHLLGSDKVGIYLGRQHWALPDGQHEIDFSRLQFDSKGQRFELDSFSFFQKATPEKGEVRIQGDKFFFTSQHLPAIYQKEELLLDTLICVNPVLTTVNKGKVEKIKDSLTRIQVTGNLFKRIQVQFISVIDGQLNLQRDGHTENTATRKANMSIYNLSVDPEATPSLRTDSIRINLKKLEFITKDSLFRLGIDEFSIRQNDVLFRNVSFGPTSFNRSEKEVVFTAPSLLLKDINITDLMQKHLKASGAELYRPLIVVYDKRGGGISGAGTGPAGRSSAGGPAVMTAISPHKLALFYRSLHGMSELIDAPHFIITDGAANFQTTGAQPVKLTVKGFNTHILLNQLFESDSLVDIKHAIPDLRIGELNLVSKGAHIKVMGYRFDGVKRLSRGEQFEAALANGTEIKGKGIYWRVFDWDVYQKTKDIQIDSLHVDELAVHAIPSGAGIHSPGGEVRSPDGDVRSPDSVRELPVIRIGQLTVNNIFFDGKAGKGDLHFSAQKLHAEGIGSAKRVLTWNHASMHLADIALNGKNSRIRLGEVSFDDKTETVLKGLEVESGASGVRLSVPLIRMRVELHSSDLSQLSIPALLVDDAALHYAKTAAKDTLAVDATLALQMKDIHPGKTIQAGEAKITIKQADIRYSKDSMTLSVNHLAAAFDDRAFSWAKPVKISWQQLATKTTISEGRLHYKGKKVTADAADFSWNPSGNRLQLRHFSVIPNESQEETFKQAPWQTDYIYVKGEALTLTGIRPDRLQKDSLIRINKLLLDEAAIAASRDKNMPFRHGVEKPMPTKLINAIPFPVRVDSILLHRSSVVYNELSSKTHQWSHIPFEDLNAAIVNVSNRNNRGDTLKVLATARLFNSTIRPFIYEESYGDSLSGFFVRSHLSPIDLTLFSQVSIPMGNVSVTSGHADTLYSYWEGNKYAATGSMHFFYKDLKIRILDKEDSKKRHLLPVVETWAANLILPDQRRRAAAIFVERDREKFIFNYWVKAISSGALTTVGIKKDKDYRKKYLEKYKQYSLPEKRMDAWKK
ncbi:MAG TPA: hypothetical protein VNS58_28150 [Puia sp.]|nr:hypothetical protein [Puia sp.]